MKYYNGMYSFKDQSEFIGFFNVLFRDSVINYFLKKDKSIFPIIEVFNDKGVYGSKLVSIMTDLKNAIPLTESDPRWITFNIDELMRILLKSGLSYFDSEEILETLYESGTNLKKEKYMHIVLIDDEQIVFSNGNTITYGHEQDCCEDNWADFKYLKDDETIYNIDFEEDLCFEAVEKSGFIFGNKSGKMYFIPCYSDQNGYYTSDIDIYYNGEMILRFDAEERFE